MRVVEFATLLVGVVCFVAVAHIGTPTFVAGDWTETDSQLIQDRLHENVLDDLSARLTTAQLKQDVPCRLPPKRFAIENEEIADHLYAVYAIEDYNRPRAVRVVENSLMRAMLMFEFSIPDWSLGPLQIKPSTAIPYLAAAGGPPDGNLRDAANLLLDSCAHGKIGVAIIVEILEQCRNSASPQHVCFAEAYNGDANNPAGPKYSDAVRMLVPRSDAVALVDDEFSPRSASTATNIERGSLPKLVEELEAIRTIEASLPDRDAALADWIRGNRRLADKLTETSGIVDVECRRDTAPEICATLEDMSLQAAEKWRELFLVIGSENTMQLGSPVFGPSSYAVEALAWSLITDEELRGHFSPAELSAIGVALENGVRRYEEENPRYILTSTVFECLKNDPEMSVNDLWEIPTSGSAQLRDSKLVCMRAFFSRLLK